MGGEMLWDLPLGAGCDSTWWGRGASPKERIRRGVATNIQITLKKKLRRERRLSVRRNIASVEKDLIRLQESNLGRFDEPQEERASTRQLLRHPENQRIGIPHGLKDLCQGEEPGEGDGGLKDTRKFLVTLKA